MVIKATENLKLIRITKGYSIQGLARAMNVNASVVFKMEKGNPIRPATAKKTCDVLAESFENLFIIEE